jgi:Asp-tRNA(Asn)/Glu-tRNA(Gln) amidotransferase A subunit family amidase
VTVKESYNVAGLPTTWGFPPQKDFVPGEDALSISRVKAAGGVILGKTNVPVGLADWQSYNDIYGTTNNPFDLGRTPGGSSGGAAAAVAAGIVPVAGASDGGGSIRIPAACCGLFGLKAGRGLIPSGPVAGEGLQGAVSEGVISRSVRDSAAMLDLLAGPEPTSPYDAPRPAGSFLEQVGTDPGKLRIGVRVPSAINPNPHPEARAAVAVAVAALTALGHEVEELPQAPFDDSALAKDFLITWFVHLAWQVAEIKAATGCGDEAFEQDTLLVAALGRASSGVEHCGALERRHDHVRRLAAFHQEYDLLLTPTLATPPPRIGEFELPKPAQLAAGALLKVGAAGLLTRINLVDKIVAENLGWVPYTQLSNLTGRPAMSVPLHWTAAGLPLGVQFVAAPGGEGRLLRLASQLEQAHPWAERRAPL